MGERLLAKCMDQIDSTLDELESGFCDFHPEIRQIAIATQKLEEAKMWISNLKVHVIHARLVEEERKQKDNNNG